MIGRVIQLDLDLIRLMENASCHAVLPQAFYNALREVGELESAGCNMEEARRVLEAYKEVIEQERLTHLDNVARHTQGKKTDL